jgi:hypothetical protein
VQTFAVLVGMSQTCQTQTCGDKPHKTKEPPRGGFSIKPEGIVSQVSINAGLAKPKEHHGPG